MNAGMDDLYREVILDHHRSPRCREPLTDADAEAAGKNPSCGDEVTLQLAFDGDKISAEQAAEQIVSILEQRGILRF